MGRAVRVVIANGFAGAGGRGGNGAGLVLPPDALGLSDADKLAVAREVALSETVFMTVVTSKAETRQGGGGKVEAGHGGTSKAEAMQGGTSKVEEEEGEEEKREDVRGGVAKLRLQYFTPEQEVDVCGHATVAAMGWWARLRDDAKFHADIDRAGIVPESLRAAATVPIVTRAGELAVRFETEAAKGGAPLVFMTQNVLTIGEDVAIEDAAACLGLDVDAIDTATHRPLVASTGLRDMFVAVKRGALRDARPDMARISALSKRHNTIGMHVWSPRADAESDGGAAKPAAATSFDVRNFAPLVGIDEECATGTANCALASLLLHQWHHTPSCCPSGTAPQVSPHCFHFRQGHLMGKDATSDVFVRVPFAASRPFLRDKPSVGGRSAEVTLRTVVLDDSVL